MNVSLTEAEGRLPDLVSAALAGDEVVIEGNYELKDGMAVQEVRP